MIANDRQNLQQRALVVKKSGHTLALGFSPIVEKSLLLALLRRSLRILDDRSFQSFPFVPVLQR
jgi:hypothetical protein